MKVVVVTGEQSFRIEDQPTPRARGDLVVVKIHVAPMCTEFKAYKSGAMGHPFGHEAAGEVVEVAQPGAARVGDRVVVMPQYPCGRCALCLRGDYIHCQSSLKVKDILGSEWGTDTYAEYLVKQDWLLVPIPEGMSYEHASMACCGFGPTFGGMELTAVDAFDTVLVTGLGPVGLGAVINARYRGARVVGVESNRCRAELARALGAETVLDPVAEDIPRRAAELTGGRGVDAAIECSGVGAAAVSCIRSVRRRGRVALVGGSGDFTLNGWGDVISKGLSLFGAWHWNLGHTSRIMKVIADSGALIDRMVTHRFPMSRVGEAWDLQLQGNCGKVLLYPHQEPAPQTRA
jgi:threonine dehydrogenase-like Zn-dependent dehydrogenase